MQAKMKALCKKLDEENNARKPGTIAKVEYTGNLNIDDLKFEEGTIKHIGNHGTGPWLSAFRPHTWRYGPSAWPLPGVGSLISAVTSGTFLLILRLTPFVEQGLIASRTCHRLRRQRQD